DAERPMRMLFDGMTSLDYELTFTLVLSNAAILKQDKAGMLTFSVEIGHNIPAEKHNHQMRRISDTVNSEQTPFKETEFGNLYAFSRKHINKRSLIFIYTNYETIDVMNRQLPYLRMLNKSHVVVVVVFKNTELVAMAKEKATKTIGIYNKIIAEHFEI